MRVARAVRDATGLRTVFHPHAAGFVETPWEVDELMRRTDPTLVGLCLDTGHLMLGGGDPLEIYRRYAARVWHVVMRVAATVLTLIGICTVLSFAEGAEGSKT